MTERKKFKKYANKTANLDTKCVNKINDNLVAVELLKENVVLNKPLYVGMAILDLSKLRMAEFHYDVMMKVFGPERAKMLFTDTDSFAYHIQSDDYISELTPYKKEFDSKGLNPDHPLFLKENIQVPGLMKDEFPDWSLSEFVGCRAKMYSIKKYLLGKNEPDYKKIAKGVVKSTIKKHLLHDHYKNVVDEYGMMYNKMNTIRSKDHNLYTIKTNKITSLIRNHTYL